MKRGALPKFSDIHLWKTLDRIYSEGEISRKKLASQIGLGEGTIRTILRYFKAEDFVVIEQTGIKLTEKGRKKFEKSRLQTLSLGKIVLGVGKFNCATLVKNKSNKIKLGIEQRDCAIKAGALGATTLICKKNKICFPGERENLKLKYPKIINMLSSKFKPENNDVIIIGSANNFKKAEEGALAGALELVNFKL